MKEAAYKGMVRPILEYGSSVWDPKAVVGGTAGPAMAGPLFWPKMVLAGPLFLTIMIFFFAG